MLSEIFFYGSFQSKIKKGIILACCKKPHSFSVCLYCNNNSNHTTLRLYFMAPGMKSCLAVKKDQNTTSKQSRAAHINTPVNLTLKLAPKRHQPHDPSNRPLEPAGLHQDGLWMETSERCYSVWIQCANP